MLLCFPLSALDVFYSENNWKRFLREKVCKVLEIFFHWVNFMRKDASSVVYMQVNVSEELKRRKRHPTRVSAFALEWLRRWQRGKNERIICTNQGSAKSEF